MRINYSVTGQERKRLVKAISQELDTPYAFLYAPTFAYIVGGYTIDKSGVLEGTDNHGLIAKLRDICDFISISKYDCEADNARKNATFYPLQSNSEPTDTTLDRITVEIPKNYGNMGELTERDITKIENLVKSKATLIKKALGIDTLIIEQTDTTLKFPWFTSGIHAENNNIYTTFITRLCATARQQARVNGNENPAENEKYTFRCFLLKLGFIGVFCIIEM